MKNLSSITNRMFGQPMFSLLDKAKKMEKSGKEIIHYEIGDPNFKSPQIAIDSAKVGLDMNLTHYTISSGFPPLKEAVTDYIKRYNFFRPSINQVLICPANAIIDFVCRCVVNEGEEVIYPDPGFPTYHSVIEYNKFVSVPIKISEEKNFRMDPSDVRKKITSKTRLIIMNSSHNPTGSVMTFDEVKEMFRIAEEYDVYLLTDEVYSRIIYGMEFSSPALYDQCKERTIILSSWSKLYSMSGWRLGYAVAPENLIEKMSLLLQTIISCLPPFIQFAGMEVIKGPQTIIEQRVIELKERRDILIDGLNSIPHLSCLKPEGAFYAFPNIKKTGMSSIDYCDRLLKETGVCALPGCYFGEYGEGYIRFCYASVNKEEIEKSIKLMHEFHKKI